MPKVAKSQPFLRFYCFSLQKFRVCLDFVTEVICVPFRVIFSR